MLKPDFELPTPLNPPPPPLPEQEPFSPSALTASFPPPPPASSDFTSDSASLLLDDVPSPNVAGVPFTDDGAVKTTAMMAPRGLNDASDAGPSLTMGADSCPESRGYAASAMEINGKDDVDAESCCRKPTDRPTISF